MTFKTDYVFCPKFGRRNAFICLMKCEDSDVCRGLKEHFREQYRFIEETRQDSVLPAVQRFLPGWIRQPWPEPEKKEENKKERREKKDD